MFVGSVDHVDALGQDTLWSYVDGYVGVADGGCVM